jgi:hypothetical protein
MTPLTVLAVPRATLATLERAHAQQTALIAAYRLVIADQARRQAR